LAHLAITLFGGFQAELDSQPLIDFGMDKNRVLLAYLVLESERPHRREALANLLWSEHSQSAARSSLRQALYHLRKLIMPGTEAEQHLLITPNQVQFNRASDHWLDVAEFNSRISTCQLHHPSGLNLCAGCLQSLQRAVDLYQGEMLAGLTLPRCTQFTDWQIICQEYLHNQALLALALLANDYEANLAYDQLLACSQRKIELEPWRESAYRQQMWALAMTGQREQALLRYKTLEEVLQQELGVLPTEDIRRLYEQIRDGNLPGRSGLRSKPAGSSGQAHSSSVDGATPLVGRNPQLAKLDGYLRESFKGHGRIVFICGEAGSGKTALMNEFACRAMLADSDLLVAGGTCNDYRGLGDPFQPFREILETLAGIAAKPYERDGSPQEYARRLRMARPVLLQTLLEADPCLTATLLPVQDLLQRARETVGLDSKQVSRLETLAAQLTTRQQAATRRDSMIAPPLPEATFFMGSGLYNQIAGLLRAISDCFPLLILIDNLQWMDCASASLLFHLASHLSGARILLLGAYQPEALTAAPGLACPPLAGMLHEFQRRFGEAPIDLSDTDGRAFVHAYLDSQPNHFDQAFREMLYRHTSGNALFAVELVHAMQRRGEVVQDRSGHWVQESPINWDQLPARVEAVVAERLSRLDSESLILLKTASLQGEIFSAGLVARLLGVAEDKVTTLLSDPLCKRHRLVSPLNQAGSAGNHRARYRFRGLLIQKYLYQSLDDVEREHLQRSLSDQWRNYA
jgi:DNA-binding SARP family transcriptional activator